MAARDPENKQAASKSWPLEAHRSREIPRKQAGCIKVVAPKGFSQSESTQKVSGAMAYGKKSKEK